MDRSRVRFHLRPSTFHLLVVALLMGVPTALSEEITWTTYQPSPRGVYRAVRVTDSLGVGTMTPVASAILEVLSSRLGFLLPRLSLGQRNSIQGPVAGLVLFNTNTNQLELYNGTRWGGVGSDSADGWTDDGRVVRLTTASDVVGIGTNTPSVGAKLEVAGTVQLRRLSDASAGRRNIDSNALELQGSGAPSTWRLQHVVDALGAGGPPTRPSRLTFLSPSGTEVMVLRGDGTVGIGTTNPTTRLEVAGRIRADRFNVWPAPFPGVIVNPVPGPLSIVPTVLQGVRASLVRDRTNPSYVVDPAGSSLLQSVRVEQTLAVRATPGVPSQPVMEVNGGVRLGSTGLVRPTCGSGTRGMFWFTDGGGGGADLLGVCLKKADDIYEWGRLF